ncbi:MAG: UDP-glucose 4-epimerase GalE [Anaerolineaceae bacterium]|nr:UDP-glucose 4-epimerase GalE [Anaerolineaceae bacterium]
MKILVTGGAGYIGSTICSALIDAGHTPVILDSLITGRIEFTKDRIFYKGDIADSALVNRIFTEHPNIFATIHCAALIIVPESTVKPFEYYHENVGKSLELFHTLDKAGCKRLVISSSASIYDVVPGFMVTESAPLKPSSPYARTKYIMEMILRDYCAAYSMHGIALRYFNPIGADPEMRTGLQIANPSHAIGQLVDVQLGKLPQFTITGTDYDTRDGTGIRDYIHVWDLAQAHVRAVENFDTAFKNAGNPEDNYLVINLGTGRGVTVRELVTAFEAVVGKKINKADGPRRPGDTAGSFCNADTAKILLGWEAKLSIEDGISDALKWGAKRDSVLPD